MGIGFFVGSLSTLRPLFARRSDDGSQRLASRERPQEAYEIARIERPQRAAVEDVKRLSQASRESVDDLVRDRGSVSKTIEAGWPLP